MNNSLTDRGAGKQVIQEVKTPKAPQMPAENPLINGAKQLGEESRNLMGDLERHLRNRKK